MAQVNIRIDDELKEKAEELFDELGLNMSTAFNIFIKTAIRHKGIPFYLTLDNTLMKPKRQLGFLKDKVPTLPDSFFEPLPEEDLQAWGL